MATTERLYIDSATSLKEKIDRYDTIITALENLMINSGTESAVYDQYTLNDGQIDIRTRYRSVEDIADAIAKYERLRNIALNKLNGAAMVLRPWRGLI